MATLRDTFLATWGHEPYDYQVRVSEALLSGSECVILVAPTGSGKTKAALHPLVYSRLAGGRWADRLLYALPLRTLTSSLYSQHAEALRGAGLRAGMQTGIHKDDPYFRSDVCFATIDQLLSAYVGEPVSVTLRQANIPAAALVGAYAVFDEFHLLETERAMATVIDLARRLKGFTPLLIMTATAPESAVSLLAAKLGAEVIVPTAEDLQRMPSQSTRSRTYIKRRGELTASVIRAEHRERTIAVFNTVARAQEVFEELRRLGPPVPPTNLLVLHSRFLAQDRQRIESRLLELLKEGSTANVILIATQVVEVGLNISCDRLLTEVAPANNLVQRAGRCARFAKESGEVQIFDVPLSRDGRPLYAPYPRTQCSLTEGVMKSLLASPSGPVSFAWERNLVDQALGEVEAVALKACDLVGRAHGIERALTTEPQAAYRRFVRSVDAVSIILHAAPEELDLKRGIEALSVSTGTLKGALRRLDLTGQHRGAVLYPEWNVGADANEEEGAPLVRRWVPLECSAHVGNHWLLALRPDVADYDPDVGLRFLLDDGSRTDAIGRPFGQTDIAPPGSAPATGKPSSAGSGPEVVGPESFREHALDVARRAAQLAQAEGPCGVARLARVLGAEPEAVFKLIELAAMLHDVGKLTRRWQSRAWEVEQQASGRTRPQSDLGARYLAHTTQPRPAGGRMPPHSVAGAIVVYDLLRQFAPQAWRLSQESLAAAAIAVARHHHPLASTLDSLEMDRGAEGEIRAVLDPASGAAAVKVRTSFPAGELERYCHALLGLVRPSCGPLWSLHWLIVRFLRLADQASQAQRSATAHPS